MVLAYVEHLERSGELDLEAATEFLVLIAALLELKSRLMLPSEDEEGLDLEPQEAAEELLARMLEYHRYRGAARHLRERLAEPSTATATARLRCRPSCGACRPRPPSAPMTRSGWPRRSASCCACPPPLDLRHVRRPGGVGGAAPAPPARPARSRPRFSFDEAVRGRDRLTEAVTLFALLELYKAGEAKWEQEVPFGPITVVRA